MATKKKPSLRTQARRLGKSRYASFLEELNRRQTANRTLYDTASKQRVEALNRELGSIQAAEATSLKNIEAMRAASSSASQQAIASSQENSAATQAARNQANSNMLSSLEAEAQRRGLSSGSGGALSEMQKRLGSQDSTMNAVALMNLGSLERMGQMEQTKLNNAGVMSNMVSTTAQSGARGSAQSVLDEMFNSYQAERLGIQAERATKKLEKKDYINQTFLTLKDKRAAEKLAKQQAQMQAAIAQGELDFQNMKFQVDTQYKYDKMAADKAKTDMANKLKAQGYSHKRAMDMAELALKQDKNRLDWERFKANPTGNAVSFIQDLIASNK